MNLNETQLIIQFKIHISNFKTKMIFDASHLQC